jgi:hypothetical protein
MEVIKKTILQITTTERITGSTGNSYYIIPNTGVTYHFKIGLVQEAYDWGFFDVIPYYPYYPYYGTDNDGLLSFDFPIGIENLFT